jgi:hypothetical protein
MIEQAEDQYGIFEYYPLDVPPEHRSYIAPTISHDIVRSHLMDQKLWNRSVSIPKLMTESGYVLLEQAKLFPYGRSPRLYVKEVYGIHKLSQGEQFKWVVKHLVLTNNKSLMSNAVKQYAKDYEVSAESVLKELKAKPQANLDLY